MSVRTHAGSRLHMNTDLMHQCVWGVYVLCMGLLGVDMSYLFIISACVYMHGITVV